MLQARPFEEMFFICILCTLFLSRCRGKSVKFLESNPFQIVLCVLVLVDAGVVIAEILLDLHAIRGENRVSKFIPKSHWGTGGMKWGDTPNF